MKEAESKNPSFIIDNWFHTIYKSEHCNESRKELMEDMTFEEFAALSDDIMYWIDLDRAAEIDSAREQATEQARNKR